MNALFAILLWIGSMFGFSGMTEEVKLEDKATIQNSGHGIQIDGVHTTAVNPRTVVALEDTHFRPSK